MTENDFLKTVMDYARLKGWKLCHFRTSLSASGRYLTAIQGDAGFPDLVLARRGRVVFAELKSSTGKLSQSQKSWLDELIPSESYVWKPEDWDDIIKVLE